MYNFVYCFDKNFNTQSAVSIYSLLENVDEQINLYIIHNEPNTFEEYSKKLSKHSKCKKIDLIEVVTEVSFPNIENNHISIATYFRIFIFKYLKNLDHVIYLDSDTVVLKNPLDIINDELTKLVNSENIISAVDETTKEISPDIFERLDLTGTKYFNAGVIIINLNKAKNENTFNNLISTMLNLNSKIKQWDQDVLNKYFDEKICELNQTLNVKFDADIESENFNSQHTILHYLGSKKPWHIEYLLMYPNNHFQLNYQQFTNSKNYFLTTKWKKNMTLTYLKQIFKFKKFINKKNYKLLKPVLSVLVNSND